MDWENFAAFLANPLNFLPPSFTFAKISRLNSPVFYISLIGMALSLPLFIYNGGFKKAKAFLAGFIFLFSLSYFIQSTFVFSHSLRLIMWFAAGPPSTAYLIGPFAYFYVRSILRDDTQLSKTDYLHFLVFLFVFIGTQPYIFSDMEYKLNVARVIESNQWGQFKQYRPNVLVPPFVNRYLRPAHAFAYSAAVCALLYQYRHRLFHSKNYSQDFQITRKWILFFSGFFLMASAIYLIAILYYDPSNKAAFISSTHPLMILVSICLVLMFVTLLFFPHILYGLPARHAPEPAAVNVSYNHATKPLEAEPHDFSDDEATLPEKEKYKQLFSENYLQVISSKTEEWMKEEHYLEEDCTLPAMAVKTQIPMHHLSYYFNNILEIKFTDWRNELRINYAKSLLDRELSKSITIEALARNCGFASQTTFNRAFKAALGITPSQYIRLRK